MSNKRQKNLSFVFLISHLCSLFWWLPFFLAADTHLEKTHRVQIQQILSLSGNGQVLTLPLEQIDVSPYVGIRIKVTHLGEAFGRVEAYFGEAWQTMKSGVHLKPNESGSIDILFKRNASTLGDLETTFPGMTGIPGGSIVHWSKFDFVKGEKKLSFKAVSASDLKLRVDEISLFGRFIPPQQLAEQEGFYPFVDRYGQYQHEQWSGKVDSDEDLHRALLEEQKDLAAHPQAPERSSFGGWLKGPKLRATGHFRVSKVQGKWWLVTPEGHLFWSYGVTGVSHSFAHTLVEGREHLFEEIPAVNDAEFGMFITPKNPSFSNQKTMSYGMANLKRKYGPQWKQRSAEIDIKRVLSWGMNSLGMWSSLTHEKQKVPYVTTVHFDFPKIVAELRCPDAFSPLLRERMRSSFEQHAQGTHDDPYNIGYFICNELRFAPPGDHKAFYVCDAYLKREKNNEGRQCLIRMIRDAYANQLQVLNREWKTSYGSFDEIQALPYSQKELGQRFERHYSETLYAMFRAEIKRVAKDKLYLGSRFVHDSPSHIMDEGARHMDVVSMNWYQMSPDGIHLPHGLDKPMIIGEFHFGAVGLGVYNPGLVAVGNQKQRAFAMYSYLQDALLHHNIVGAHWFQYRSQAFTGRKDGECYQIGMVDICDNPNPEQRRWMRKLGAELYSTRFDHLRP